MTSSNRTRASKTGEDSASLLREDPDFISSKRLGNSLKKLRERYPDGAPRHVVASVFLLSEEELSKVYDDIVKKMRNAIGA